MLSTISRLTASRTKSLHVQWLRCSGGASQAKAINRHICSALNFPGHPGRALSANNLPTAARNLSGLPAHFSNSAHPCVQRRRQRPTVSSHKPKSRPIALLAMPCPACKIIRARTTKLWGVSRPRAMLCSKLFCSCVRFIGVVGRAIVSSVLDGWKSRIIRYISKVLY